MFQSIEEVVERLAEQSCVSDKRLATVVFLATRLGVRDVAGLANVAEGLIKGRA